MVRMNSDGVDLDKYPLIGMGDYLMKMGNLELSKHSYKATLSSPKATEANKKEASEKIVGVDKKMREIAKKLVNFNVVVKKVKGLEASPHMVEMPMSSTDYTRLKGDIEETGIQVPLAVDKNGKVICGKNRLKIAKELGIEEVPCFTISLEKAEDIKKYSLSDNLNRRQLNREERMGWVAEMIRLRNEAVQGRPKGGKRKKGDPMSNREIAEASGVSVQTVGREESKQTVPIGTVCKPKPGTTWVKDTDKWSISKGKDLKRDYYFADDISMAVKAKVKSYYDDLSKGKKMMVEVTYQVQEDE